MRRSHLLRSLATVLALAVAVAGCGGAPADSADSSTIKFWSMPFWIGDRDKVADLVQEFNSSQSKVTVELTILEWADGREKIKQAVAAGTGPDVFLMNNGLDADFLASDRLASLDQLGYTAEDIGRFTDLVKVNEHKGKLYGAPLYFDSVVMLYRTDILSQYGFKAPPKTWDELKNTAKTITTQSGGAVHGWQFKGMDDHLNAINSTWETFLLQAGGSLTSADYAKSTQAGPAGQAAMDYMRGFYTEKISPVGTSAVNGFIDGKVAMFNFFQTVIANVDAGGDKTKGKWAVAPMPTGPVNGKSMVGGHSLVADAKSKNLDAAGTFMRWLASPERSQQYMDFFAIFPYQLDKVPAEVKSKVEEKITTDPNWAAIFEQVQRNTADVVVQDRYGYSARWDAQKAQIVAGVNGQAAVGSALAAIDSQVNQALATR